MNKLVAAVMVALLACRAMAGDVRLNNLDGTNGFEITPAQAGAMLGEDLSAGDLNGDGVPDIIVSSYTATPDPKRAGAGIVYVLWGGQSLGASISVADLDGTAGFQLNGESAHDLCGTSVSFAGDVNNDGFGDLVIGAPDAENFRGVAYVVYGAASFPAVFELSSLDGTNGFRIVGTSEQGQYGENVAAAGDINGDGFADVVVASYLAADAAGTAYVVFGGAAVPGVVSLDDIDGTNGFSISGLRETEYYLGFSCSGVGDINDDGLDDVAFGATGVNDLRGAVYIVFGSTSPFAAAYTTRSLKGETGFTVEGGYYYSAFGSSVGPCGDVNGDGVADFVSGASEFTLNQFQGHPGQAYVVYGNKTFPSTLSVLSLDGTNGFVVNGSLGETLGAAVSTFGGDVNGDGLGDVVIGGPTGGGGVTRVLYGQKTFDKIVHDNSIPSDSGFSIYGSSATSNSGNALAMGDFNQDGFSDILVAASHADRAAGKAFVVYGSPAQ